VVLEARSKGITNLSKFVREQLAEFFATHGRIEEGWSETDEKYEYYYQ
jgi:hypothetical protein